MKYTVLLFVFMVSACAVKPYKFYEGEILDSSKHAIISALAERKGIIMSGQITEINGKAVNITNASSHLVLPGTYDLTIRVTADMVASGTHVSWKEASLTVSAEVVAGHTYIPRILRKGEEVSVIIEDAGVDFPEECLPLFKQIERSSNPGSAIHRHKKKCEEL